MNATRSQVWICFILTFSKQEMQQNFSYSYSQWWKLGLNTRFTKQSHISIPYTVFEFEIYLYLIAQQVQLQQAVHTNWKAKRFANLQICRDNHSPFHEDRWGVSEFLHVLIPLGYLSPFTAAAYDSSSAISCGVSFTDRAPTFWLKFSILVVPGIGHTSLPWWWTQASASCDGVHPFLAAISFTRSNMRALVSRFSGWNLGLVCNKHSALFTNRWTQSNKMYHLRNKNLKCDTPTSQKVTHS